MNPSPVILLSPACASAPKHFVGVLKVIVTACAEEEARESLAAKLNALPGIIDWGYLRLDNCRRAFLQPVDIPPEFFALRDTVKAQSLPVEAETEAEELAAMELNDQYEAWFDSI